MILIIASIILSQFFAFYGDRQIARRIALYQGLGNINYNYIARLQAKRRKFWILGLPTVIIVLMVKSMLPKKVTS